MAEAGRTSSDNLELASLHSLRLHAFVGGVVVILMVVGLGAWAMTTEIAGAVVSYGVLVVGSGSKPVQPAEGGIVAEVLVEDGDQVEAGDLLIRLEGTSVRANAALINSQLGEALAQQARLRAEAAGTDEIETPAALTGLIDPARIDSLVKGQENLLASRRAVNNGQTVRVEEQISQLERQIAGLESQLEDVDRQLEIINRQLEDYADLLSRGLVQSSQVSAIEREQSRLIGEQGRIASNIAVTRAGILERQAQIEQSRSEFQSQVLEDLQRVSATIAEYLQQKIAAEDRLARLDVRAPQSGRVHELSVRGPGAVIASGEVLMFIVPQEEQMHVEAHVSPLEIDRIYLGQQVRLRFASLDTRTTPELYGTVERVSPDQVIDSITRQSYYVVRITVSDTELDRLPKGTRLSASMPVNVFAQTGERTVMEYLLKPLAEQVNRTFREE